MPLTNSGGRYANGVSPGGSYGEVLFPEGLMDHQLVEDPRATPTLRYSLLKLQEDYIVVGPQEAPMVSHLQIPMVPSILGLMGQRPPLGGVPPNMDSEAYS